MILQDGVCMSSFAPCWSLQGSRATTSKLPAEQTPLLFSSEGSRLSRLIFLTFLIIYSNPTSQTYRVTGRTLPSRGRGGGRRGVLPGDAGVSEASRSRMSGVGFVWLVFQDTENWQQLALSNFAKSPIVLVWRRWQFINQGSSSLFKLAVCSSWSRIQKAHSLRPVSRMAMTRQ